MREPKLAAEIAKQLHKFHQVEVPGSKEPQLWNDTFKFFKQGQGFSFPLLAYDLYRVAALIRLPDNHIC